MISRLIPHTAAFAAWLAAGLAATAARADVQVPAVFGDHMVLQRDQKNPVWGWAEPGETVTVTLEGQTHVTRADEDGAWRVVLDPLSAGGPYDLNIKGKNELNFADVMVGEVWICSGQSNMQWPVSQSNDPDLESLAANFPDIRLITVPQVGTQEPQRDFNGRWQRCRPETVRDFSAIGFFFGRQLHQTLGVPIGLIDNAWGGSAAEAWVRRDLLESDPRFAGLMERWKGIEANYPQAKAEYEKKLAEWREAVAKAKEEGKPEPARPGGDPDGLMRGNARPGNIYNGVLKPTIGYGIRGVIWYQGESNASRAYQYRDLFPLMISAWREEWGQGEFPFYWVQLADFLAEKSEPGDSAWAELRERQTMTLTRLPRTGQAVIIDLGEGQDIHPRNKQDVAKRLVRWALAKDYGIDVPYQSPLYQSMEVRDGKVLVTFDAAGAGLRTFDVAEVRGFTVAGEDRKFYPAQARIVAPNQVEVRSEHVEAPVAVRYGWADNPVVNLYSREGLPVTPFRTDDWPGVTADAK